MDPEKVILVECGLLIRQQWQPEKGDHNENTLFS